MVCVTTVKVNTISLHIGLEKLLLLKQLPGSYAFQWAAHTTQSHTSSGHRNKPFSKKMLLQLRNIRLNKLQIIDFKRLYLIAYHTFLSRLSITIECLLFLRTFTQLMNSVCVCVVVHGFQGLKGDTPFPKPSQLASHGKPSKLGFNLAYNPIQYTVYILYQSRIYIDQQSDVSTVH